MTFKPDNQFQSLTYNTQANYVCFTLAHTHTHTHTHTVSVLMCLCAGSAGGESIFTSLSLSVFSDILSLQLHMFFSTPPPSTSSSFVLVKLKQIKNDWNLRKPKKATANIDVSLFNRFTSVSSPKSQSYFTQQANVTCRFILQVVFSFEWWLLSRALQ